VSISSGNTRSIPIGHPDVYPRFPGAVCVVASRVLDGMRNQGFVLVEDMFRGSSSLMTVLFSNFTFRSNELVAFASNLG
jgi:hypothetical protein